MGREVVKIIDNKNITLFNYTKKLFKNSKQVKIAVGYFFLSGWDTIKNLLPENPPHDYLKIIIGDETDQTTAKTLKTAHLKLKSQVLESITESSNKEALEKLYELLRNNKLNIKIYTNGKLHAKLYLFLEHPEELDTEHGVSPGVAIVGSSNLSRPGFTTNKELNVSLTDREAILDLNKWFEDLWINSEEFREELLKVIETYLTSSKDARGQTIQLGKLVTPRELFKILVWRLFDGRIEPIQKKDILAEFQHIGVVNAIDIINKYNGVIVADSVGLGKSFIGATIIEEYIMGKLEHWNPEHYGFKKERKALLILPPSLIPQWEHLLFKSDYFFSKSDAIIPKRKTSKKYTDKYIVYEIYQETENNRKKLGEVGLLSLGIFSNMSKKDVKKLRLNYEYDIVLIDEAHKFRNRLTNRWRNARLLRFKIYDKNSKINYQNKFILLTATPLNNTIWDIYNLIKLFSDDMFTPFKQRGINVTQLFQEFKDVKRMWKENPKNSRQLHIKAQEIKEKVLDEIMILRTRKYIKETFGKGDTIKVGDKMLSFKEPEPETIYYNDIPSYSKYKKLIKSLESLFENIKFAYTRIYTSGFVVIGNSASSLYEEKPEDAESEFKKVPLDTVLKILLSKRLESSVYAFEKTLDTMFNKSMSFYKILKKFSHKMNTLTTEQFIKELDKIGDNLLAIARKEDIEKIIEEEDITLEENTNNSKEPKNYQLPPKLRMLVNFLNKGTEESKEKIQLPQIIYTNQFYKFLKENPETVKFIKTGIEKFVEEIEHDYNIMRKIKNKLNTLKLTDKKGNPIIVGYITEEDGKYPIYAYKDPKLEKLKDTMYNDVRGMKYIIFTQYKDTAHYLYYNLLPWINDQKRTLSYLFDTRRNRLKIDLVTGDLPIESKERIIKQFAPEANGGWTEVEKHGELMVLISTDSLSEGVNLQDANGVINYDLPWNPMIIVQRVGRVSRIGSTKDVFVKNFVPAQEIEMTLGLVAKLQEKIKDITLLVGKEFYIISADEDISIETFGERLKSLAELKLSQLEEASMSEDFKFMKGGMPDIIKTKIELLNYIQDELRLRKEDFEDVLPLINSSTPVYTLISGNRMVSMIEVYRGDDKIKTEIVALVNGELKRLSPEEIVKEFKNLWNAEIVEKSGFALSELMSMLKTLDEKYSKLSKGSESLKQRGFAKKLWNYLKKQEKQVHLLPVQEGVQLVPKSEIKKALDYLSWAELNPQEVKEFKNHLLRIGAIRIKGKTPEPVDLGLIVRGVIDYFDKKIAVHDINRDKYHKIIGWWY